MKSVSPNPDASSAVIRRYAAYAPAGCGNLETDDGDELSVEMGGGAPPSAASLMLLGYASWSVPYDFSLFHDPTTTAVLLWNARLSMRRAR